VKKEEVIFLEGWISQINSLVKELNKIANKKRIKTFFSISNTTSVSNDNQNPYVTPIRLLEGGVICGVVVFSQSQALIAAKNIEGKVDKILVDAEKKIGMQIGVNKDLLTHFNIQDLSIDNNSSELNEFGNISSAVRMVVGEDKVIEYKPNDITVDAIWTYLSIKLSKLSGKKIAILGCGNIGFKLALKLVESGVNVALYRRDSFKGVLMANSINMVKPKTTIATATFCESALHACSYSEVLIGTANSDVPLISWEMIKSMAKNGLVIDVGKGNIEKEAIKKSINKNIEIIRGDVGASLYGFISHRYQMQETIQYKIGRRELTPGVRIVSGGIFGMNGDIVVDNYASPEIIYGVADGCGHMKTILNDNDKTNISEVKNYLLL
jgi:hypothetical protein